MAKKPNNVKRPGMSMELTIEENVWSGATAGDVTVLLDFVGKRRARLRFIGPRDVKITPVKVRKIKLGEE